MNKLEVQMRVLQHGKPLALSKFTWCEETNTFTSVENDLVIDFKGIDNCTFNTGNNCIFYTGDGCTFNTGWYCVFNTGDGCIFNTGDGCTFKTGWGCTFNTGWYCVFNIYDYGYFYNTSKYSVVVVRLHINTKVYQLDELVKDKFIRLSVDKEPLISAEKGEN